MKSLKAMIYEAILNNEREYSYMLYSELWYVVKWNKQTFIHYHYTPGYGSIKIIWYLSASIYPAKFRSQTDSFEVQKMTTKCENHSSSSAANTPE